MSDVDYFKDEADKYETTADTFSKKQGGKKLSSKNKSKTLADKINDEHNAKCAELLSNASGKVRIKVGDRFYGWIVRSNANGAPVTVNQEYYRCKCMCGSVCKVNAYELFSGQRLTCGHCAERIAQKKEKKSSRIPFMVGDIYRDIEVNGMVLHQLVYGYGNQRKLRETRLIEVKPLMCFSEWLTLYMYGDARRNADKGDSWVCMCTCGNIRRIPTSTLINGQPRGCEVCFPGANVRRPRLVKAPWEV